jgi:hypothetical protein
VTVSVVPLACAQTIAGRPVPAPIYGVTLDDVSTTSREVTALSRLVKFPSARVVFDRGTPASYYKGLIQKLRPVSYIMALLADSSDMSGYTATSIRSMTQSYVQTLGPLVDIWEVGNEVNGDWLGSNTMAKIQTMFDVVSAAGGVTALTFFYEGESNEARNCIDSQGGMFAWISRNFLAHPTPDTERLRLNVNYALISWYPTQCRGENPDWKTVFDRLSQIFPNSRVGFGELGTPNPQHGSSTEADLINTYYTLGKTLPGLPASYISGIFWWYFAEEMVPWPGSLGNVLNSALMAGP